MDINHNQIITWQQLTINSDHSHSEQIITWLNLLDAQAVEISTETIPDRCIIKALFLPNISIEQVKNFLQKNIDAHLEFSSEIINNTDWHKTQTSNLAPIEICKKLAIYPEDYKSKIIHDIPIYIQAIDAFGTGKHPTTFQCLKWLSEQDLHHKNIIDFGCGSGVLAITALKLGAKKSWAIDIDTQALEATHRNQSLNQIKNNQLITTTDPNYLTTQADIILANILANPLCELASVFLGLLAPGGKVLLAGMLDEQAPMIFDCYQKDFVIHQIGQLDGWLLLLAQKKKISEPPETGQIIIE